ncbi:HAD-IA family hydrolase [Streptococcus ovuberis]|uniref:HAD-IA family hydrolase n=1 Tax=Streptococcus ovuberis TaxID=1936207 RepID=A0A7X6S0T6_9STRE|nr:HAD-IA family hydrolase [Streptococcus ovuberis]NKZ20102.1 HAD-IA family hydrolase [Streptococcus ovuberis]
MTNTAFIWDFDGTLADSYPAIVTVLKQLYAQHGWAFDETEVGEFILRTSVKHLLETQTKKANLEGDGLKLMASFIAEQERLDDQIILMPGALDVLAQTASAGVRHFIYTHKGATTDAVLKRLGIADYFTEVINSTHGFARKPEPDALFYLLDKYGLDKTKTYYIGDRSLDREAAERAGIHSINLTQPDSPTNTNIEHLLDILALPIF